MGRAPAAAIPMATPTIDDSASGVLKQRAAPKASVKPTVALKTPPLGSATSSPSTTASGWSSMISWRAWLTAVIRFISRPLGGASTASTGWVLRTGRA